MFFRKNRKGAFNIPFQTAFGILAALFIAFGVFSLTPPLLQQLGDYSDVFTEAMEVNRTDFDQVAVDSAQGLRTSLSCTALINAQNPESDAEYIDYLEQEWKGWEDGVCQEATEGDGVVVGQESDTQDPVRVHCDEPNFGSHDRGSCRVYNFNLPNGFGGFGGPDNFYESVQSFLKARTEPEYFLYYQAFPEYGIEQDWENAWITDGVGVLTPRFWTRVMANYGSGKLFSTLGPKKAATNVISDQGVASGVAEVTRTAASDVLREGVMAAGVRLAHEGAWDIGGSVAEFFSAEPTSNEIKAAFIVRRFGYEFEESVENLLDSNELSRSQEEVLENDDGRELISQFMAEKVREQALGAQSKYSSPEQISNDLGRFITDLSESVTHFELIDGDEVALKIGEQLFEDEFVLNTIESTVNTGLTRASDDLLVDVEDKFYYEALDTAFTAYTVSEDSGEHDEALERYVDQYLAKEELFSEEDVAERVVKMKTVGCGSGVCEKFVEKDFSNVLDEVDGTVLDESCENFAEDNVFDLPGSQQERSEACKSAGLIAQAGISEASREIKYESVGVNSLGLKRAGVSQPEVFDLHPVANWYFVSLEPDQVTGQADSFTGAGRRFYSVSPCRTKPDDESQESYIEVSHSVETCHIAQERNELEYSDNRFLEQIDHLSEEERLQNIHGLGEDNVPSDVFMLQLSGSYYHQNERFGNIPILEGLTAEDRDIVYTRHPLVHSIPEFSSDEWLSIKNPSGLELGAGEDLEEVREDDSIEGWNNRMQFIDPEDPDAPGLTYSDVRDNIIDNYEHITYLEHLRLEQIQETFEDPDFDLIFGKEPREVSDEEKESIWEGVRNINDPELCELDSVETFTQSCDEEIEEVGRQAGMYTCDGELMQRDPYQGGDIIDFETYCTEYTQTMSDIREHLVGGTEPDASDAVYYSQLGYWEDKEEEVEDIIGDLEKAYEKKDEEVSRYLERPGTYWKSFTSNAQHIGDRQGGMLTVIPGETLFYGHPDYLWSEVIVEAQNILESELSGYDVESECSQKQEELFGSDLTSSDHFKHFIPVGRGEVDYSFDGEDYLFATEVEEDPEVLSAVKEVGEIDIDKSDIEIYIQLVEMDDLFNVECEEDSNTIIVDELEIGEETGCYLVPKNYHELEDEGVINELRFNSVYVWDISEGEDNREEIAELNFGEVFDQAFGNMRDDEINPIPYFFEFEPLVGEEYTFNEYCNDVLSNAVKLAEYDDIEANFGARGFPDIADNDEVIEAQIPERHISSEGTGHQECIHPDIGEQFLNTEFAETVDVVNAFDGGLTERVDSLEVRYENTQDHRNYCYSSATYQDVVAQVFVGGGSSLVQSAVWKAGYGMGGPTIGMSVGVASKINFVLSFAETYVSYRALEESNWPDRDFDWEERRSSITDIGEFVSNLAGNVHSMVTN